ncbi:MAG: DUF6266 family protein [Carboxylicivirga sp.]|jgi:hypothetical protein|nr:DUF6266 family protein [Carboxylicivirga sp.]
MGKIEQGILGGFSGKVGNVVGGNWKGIDYMRIKPANVANPQTPDQVDQRTKFVKVLNFLQPMTDFLRVGYKNYAIKMTQFNSAMSYNLKNAVTGTYPDFKVSYPDSLVSRGNLKGADSATVTNAAGSTVQFTWPDNSGIGNATATDKSLLLIYNEDKKQAVYTIEGPVRSLGSGVVTIPDAFNNDTVQAFIGFISEDGKDVANSFFVGNLDIVIS